MIDKKHAKDFCKDDISKIENYDKAINDKTQTWVCHHRLGLTLDGEFAHSREELKRMDMYFDRPYFELIFMTKAEHRRLHMKGKHHSDETRKKISESLKGENNPLCGQHSEEARKKLSEARKGMKFTEEHKRKIGEAHKGMTWKLVDGKRVWFPKENTDGK